MLAAIGPTASNPMRALARPWVNAAMASPWRRLRRDKLRFRGPSLDQLVRARQQRWQDLESERVCGFKVDNELKLRRLLDRPVTGFCAVQILSTNPAACRQI